MSRKVCLFGGAIRDESVLAEIPDDAEIWAVNEMHRHLGDRKPSRVFQMHVRDWREREREYLLGGAKGVLPGSLGHDCFGRNEEHVTYLRTCGVPVYGQQVWPDIPTSVRYPFEQVTEAVGIPLPPSGNKRLWATSSFGYMAALLLTEHKTCERHIEVEAMDHTDSTGRVIAQGHRIRSVSEQSVEELICIGIELPTGTNREKLWEWPNFAYYLGLATGLGITVTLPSSGTSLLSAPHYALGGHPYPMEADHWHYPGHAGVVVDEEDGVYRLGTVLD